MNENWSGGQKLFYVVLTTVMMFVVMSALGWFVRPYTDGAVAWLDSAVGTGPSGWIILGAIPLTYFVLWTTGHFDTPVVVPPRPWWWKVRGLIILTPPILSVVVFIGLVAGGAIR